jgi:glycosyltransferase involved in cell wall biosynthesis
VKVVIYIGQMVPGGAEGQIVVLTRGLFERGHDTRILTEEGLTSAVPPDLAPYVVTVPHRPRLSRLRAVREHLRQFDPDVLHLQLSSANLWGTLAAPAVPRTAVGVSFLQTDIYKKWYHFVIDRWVSARADGIWLNSRGVISRYEPILSKYRDKFRLIYNGVDTERFDASRYAPQRPAIRASEMRVPADNPVLINVANFRPEKNHPLLLASLRRLLALYQEPRKPYLVLAGEGPEKARVEAEAARLGVAPYCRFMGNVDAVERLYAAADVFVLPSDAEGFANTILEAMSSALPCVATDIAGNREALTDATGVIIPPADEDALTDALRQLLDQPARRRELGEAARRRAVGDFGLDRMVDGTVAWYRDLISAHSRKTARK